MKESKFNIYVEYKNELLIYNSLNRTYAKTANMDKIKKLIKYPDSSINSKLLNMLSRLGVIVDDSLDEDRIAKFKYLDYIYDSGLELCIIPTKQCNFRCKYCYEKFSNEFISLDIQERYIKWINKNINKYSYLSINWFGGEPLLALEEINNLSKNIIDTCKKHGKIFYASITTNGYLLNRTTIKKLLNNHINLFQITLDGLEQTHNNTRILSNGKETFEVILNNLYDIRDNIKSTTFKIIIRTNITKDSLLLLDEYLKKMFSEFGKDKRFLFYFRPVGDWGGNRVEEIKNSLIKNLDEMYEKILSSSYKLNYYPYTQMLDYGICSSAKRNYMIFTPDGKINKCTLLLEDPHNEVGYIDKNGELHINEENFSQWIINDFDDIKCFNCVLKPTCYGKNCPAKNNSIESKSRCGYETKSISQILKLLYNIKYQDKDLFLNLDKGDI